MAEAEHDVSTKNFRRNGGIGQLRDRQPGMAEDSAGSTSSRKEFDQFAEFGVYETVAVPGGALAAGTTFETEIEHEWSSGSSLATRDLLLPAREESVLPEGDHC